ncbi:MAG: 4,5-DOPA dioxygenase extradiol [Bacteroidia bacterium]|jgi:4,5-DOPA dioxygenase extradiol|nr:4,5-DOPA dioxygenase extradiol [Bacteroidia bacterium]
MKRSDFIKQTGITAMGAITLSQFGNEWLLGKSTPTMPVLFIGHGSPMNAIEQNGFTQHLQQLGKSMPKPQAIMVVSAHWQTRGTFVHVAPYPKTIHDFGGFPQALFDVQYPAKGAPEIAKGIGALIGGAAIFHDTEWGLDHGAWSILNHLYPLADVPVFQLSLDYTLSAQGHYDLAKQLMSLRNKGVLIIGSGNIVHNLGMLNWDKPNNTGFDWAIEFDDYIAKALAQSNHNQLIQYNQAGKSALLSVPTNEHYLPMLYAAAAQTTRSQLAFTYQELQMGSISMRCFQIT